MGNQTVASHMRNILKNSYWSPCISLDSGKSRQEYTVLICKQYHHLIIQSREEIENANQWGWDNDFLINDGCKC